MRFIKLLKEPKKIDLNLVEGLRDEIAEIAHKYGVSLLYIYGSLARDKMGPLSDVDLAVGLEADRAAGMDEALRLISDFQDLFGREDIDLVELNKAPPLLKMRILQHGKPVYISDEACMIKFRYETISKYLGTLYLRKSFFNYVKRAVLKEGAVK